MSSNPSYREPRRDINPRGGFRGGRGRGGFSKPSRRYWDNDDYYDRENKDRDGRRRHSRSRSRSRSRSYSRSMSRSRSPSPSRRRRSGEYDSKGQGVSQVYTQNRSAAEPYDPYIPQPNKSSPTPNNWKPAGVGEYIPQTNGGARSSTIYEGASTTALDPMQQLQIQRIQQQVQMQKLQMEQQTMDDPSITFRGYGFGLTGNPPLAAPVETGLVQTSQMYPNPSDTPGLSLGKEKRSDPSPDTSHSSKKKKDKRKKKKKRRSSSSSSSSSDDSSGSRRRRKKRGRDSDDSSDSSSDNDEEKKQNEKEKPSSSSGLTSQQREALLGQKDSYKTKLEILEREITKLQTKEDELKKSRADIRLVEENLKLQAELKGRCKAVHIVLEKINDVLQVDNKNIVERVRTPHSHPAPPPPPKISQSHPVKTTEKPLMKEVVPTDFDYFDNGQHWCRLCNVFPENVEQMLNHFHSQAHQNQVEQLGIDDKPWHKRNSLSTKNPNPGSTKVPFRGLQFFSPVEGWYCRLCNTWMGDQHCATDHLKCSEHNNNYMNFLEEHTDWESKWSIDREKARVRASAESKAEPKKSRFENRPPAAVVAIDEIGDVNGRSILVQMRNTIKVDENRSDYVSKNETSSKDSGLEEWMGKPQKIPLDIIDTQKFAEIVRQKHGNKIKEEEKPTIQLEPLRSSPSRSQANKKDKERDLRRDDSGGGERDRRRYDRVELQISSREDRERDRYREARGGRRRSRSRSRSRDRSHHGRRKSRSRSRERRDRDRNPRDKVEAVKKLPMIGKMPLYKRPFNFGKDKEKQGDDKDLSTGISSEDVPKMLSGFKTFGQHEESNTSIPSENSLSGFGASQAAPTSRINFEGFSNEVKRSGADTGDNHSYVLPESKPAAADTDLKPPGEKEAPGGTNLPDDLQQALDIIYKGGGQPIPIPPPSMSVPLTSISNIPVGVPPPATTAPYEYPPVSGSSYQNYMGYEPYQMSFDNYAPPPGYDDMEEVVSAGNVPIPHGVPETGPIEPPQPDKANTEDKEEIENDDDDMDDLRMLGIDLDDVAVVRR